MEKTLIEALRILSLLIAMLLWTFIGFFLWVPLFAQSMAVFTVFITIDAFTHRVDMREVRRKLDIAIGFWLDGFLRILDAFNEIEKGEGGRGEPLSAMFEDLGLAVLGQVVWSILYWVIFISTFVMIFLV